MSVTIFEPAPYAPAKSILDLVSRYRSCGLQPPMTAEALRCAGVPVSLVPRTLQALKALNLVDEKGKPTLTLEGLRLASEEDYPKRLTQWLDESYSEVLKYVDPATSTEEQIRDVFREYKPVGQQSRMVSLFMGLYASAGIGVEKSRTRSLSSGKPKSIVSNGGTSSEKRLSPNETVKAGVTLKHNLGAFPVFSAQNTRHIYDTLLSIWRPSQMPKEVDEAVVTLLRWVREQEQLSASDEG